MAVRSRALNPIASYLLSLVLTALTTRGLEDLQTWLSVTSHHYIRPYTIAFILPIALMTVLGGRGPGFFTLILAALLSVTVLMHTGTAWTITTPLNLTELTLLLVTGTLVTLGMDAMRRNVETLRQETARAEQEALINQIGETLRAASEPEEILRRATAAVGNALGLDRCYFVTYDLERDLAVIGPDWHRPGLSSIAGNYQMSAYRINQDPNFLSGRVQRVTDTQANDGATELGRMQMRALLRVPVQREAQKSMLTGVMTDSPREWTEAEAEMVAEVAALTRSAWELALVRRREQVIAQTLQDALRPRLPERVPGLDLADFYNSALAEASIGGDFFDVFPLDKGLYALVVGDVSGKGLAAAAQVATVRNMLRYALYRQSSVADAVTDLNRVTSDQELLVGFVTLFVGVYDIGSHVLTYASCGHEPGLVRRANGEVQELEPTGPVLGAADRFVYAQQSVTLASGDLLALYTDGLSEAGRHQHDFWGVSGIADALRALPADTRAADAITAIMDAATAHALGQLHDDVCLLVGIVDPTNRPGPSTLV